MRQLAKNLCRLNFDDYVILSILERGMESYNFVPIEFIMEIAPFSEEKALRHLKKLHEFKLVVRWIGDYVGYRLTVHGYDALALNSLVNSGVLESFGIALGVGKESDVYDAVTPSGRRVVVKAHRMGRPSFIHAKRVRGYVNTSSLQREWFHASRKSAKREFSVLKLLSAEGVAVPEPISCNRHIVVMDFVEGDELVKCKFIPKPYRVLEEIIENVRLAYRCGIIHGDLSEYNVILKPDLHIALIDWPQYADLNHPSSQYLLERDIRNVLSFFKRKFNVTLDLTEVLNYVTK